MQPQVLRSHSESQEADLQCWFELLVDSDMVRLCALLLRLISPDAELGNDEVDWHRSAAISLIDRAVGNWACNGIGRVILMQIVHSEVDGPELELFDC